MTNLKRSAKVNARMLTATGTPVTTVLIALNAVIFVLTDVVRSLNSTKLAVFASGGFGNPGVADGQYWRLLTAGFIHYGIIHIGMNMYALHGLGQSLERQLGSWRFAGVYFVGLFGGSLGALVFEPFAYTGGASGAVFGLFGCMAAALRQRGVSILKSPLGPTLVINFVLSVTIPGISVGGHFGGFVFGALAGAAVLHPRRRGRDANLDAASIVGLCVVAIILAILVAKSPINGTGLWSR